MSDGPTDETMCSNCKQSIGYEVGWDDPPQGDGHLEVQWNPADEPNFVVAETRRYCSVACLLSEVDEIPFEPPSQSEVDIYFTDCVLCDYSGETHEDYEEHMEAVHDE